MSTSPKSSSFFISLLREHSVAVAVWGIATYLVIAFFIDVVLTLFAGQQAPQMKEALGLCAAGICVYLVALIWFWFRDHVTVARLANSKKPLPQSKLSQSLDLASDTVLSLTPVCFGAAPLFYWGIYLVWAGVGWLKTGDWASLTTCDLFIKTCAFESKLLGINKVVNYFGGLNFGWSLTLVCVVLMVITSGLVPDRKAR